MHNQKEALTSWHNRATFLFESIQSLIDGGEVAMKVFFGLFEVVSHLQPFGRIHTLLSKAREICTPYLFVYPEVMVSLARDTGRRVVVLTILTRRFV